MNSAQLIATDAASVTACTLTPIWQFPTFPSVPAPSAPGAAPRPRVPGAPCQIGEQDAVAPSHAPASARAEVKR